MNSPSGLSIPKKKNLFFASLAIVGGLFSLAFVTDTLTPSDVSADTITTSNGGTLTAWVESVDPSARDGNMCLRPNGSTRNKPNFTSYINSANVRIGATNSLIDFTMTAEWRDCADTSAGYAIYSRDFCPHAGYYGGSPDNNYKANDCVKFIQNVPDSSFNTSLGCAVNGPAALSKGGGPPTNYPCTTSNWSTYNIGRKTGSPASATPSAANGQILTFSDSIPFGRLDAGTRSSGSYVYGDDPARPLEGRICQFFWMPPKGASESETECRNMRIAIRWTYTPPPSYDLSATVSGVNQNFAYTHDMPDPWYWGMTVNAAANLPPEGIGNHNVDVWRIIYPAAPSDGWSEGVITNGENGLCSALSGYSSCDRLGAYPCVNAIYGCNTLNAAGQFWRWAFDEQLGPYPIGTRVCYISRVSKPTYTSGIDDWKGSIRTCSVSGIKPKVQAWGYDTKATGRIKTSLTNVSGNLYGSWGEYGVLSNGRNLNMASGNGLLGGRSSADTQQVWSPLTFANDAATAFSCPGFGCYGGIAMPNVSVQGAVDAPGGGDYTVNNYDQVRALVGGSKGKLRVNGTLTIAGNLEYPASVDGIANIPKIQLIADDIVINRGVLRVDPWLIAYRPATNTYGRISTCDEAGVPGNPFVSMASAGLYGGPSGICRNPLKFNSPLIADKVYLYRTYDQQDGAIAAETLNVRADNYLSSYVGGGTTQPVATTDAVVELPPRF